MKSLIKKFLKKTSTIFFIMMMFVVFSTTAFAQSGGSLPALPIITPLPLPVTYANLLQGGFMQVASSSPLLAITCERRSEGMLVWVKDASPFGPGTGGTGSQTFQLIGSGLGCAAGGVVDPVTNLIKNDTAVSNAFGPIAGLTGVWKIASLGGGGISNFSTTTIVNNNVNNLGGSSTSTTYTYLCDSNGICSWARALWDRVFDPETGTTTDDIYNSLNKRVGIRVGSATGTELLNPARQDLTIGEDRGNIDRGNFAVQMRTPQNPSSSLIMGGDLSLGNHIFKIAAIDVGGGETKASVATNPSDCSSNTPSQTCTITWDAAPGATFYRVYNSANLGASWNYALVPGSLTSFNFMHDNPSGDPNVLSAGTDNPKDITTAYVNKISADNLSWFSGGSVLIGKDTQIGVDNPITGANDLVPKLEIQDNQTGDLGSTLTNYLGVLKSIVLGSPANLPLNNSSIHFWGSNSTPTYSSNDFDASATTKGAGIIYYDSSTASSTDGRFKISQADNPGFCELYPEGTISGQVMKWNDVTKCWEAGVGGGGDSLWKYFSIGNATTSANTIKNTVIDPANSTTTVSFSSLVGSSPTDPATVIEEARVTDLGDNKVCFDPSTGKLGYCYTYPIPSYNSALSSPSTIFTSYTFGAPIIPTALPYSTSFTYTLNNSASADNAGVTHTGMNATFSGDSYTIGASSASFNASIPGPLSCDNTSGYSISVSGGSNTQNNPIDPNGVSGSASIGISCVHNEYLAYSTNPDITGYSGVPMGIPSVITPIAQAWSSNNTPQTAYPVTNSLTASGYYVYYLYPATLTPVPTKGCFASTEIMCNNSYGPGFWYPTEFNVTINNGAATIPYKAKRSTNVYYDGSYFKVGT